MKIYMNDDEVMDKSIKKIDMPQSLQEPLSNCQWLSLSPVLTALSCYHQWITGNYGFWGQKKMEEATTRQSTWEAGKTQP